MEVKTYPITWEEMHRDARLLARKLQEHNTGADGWETAFSHIVAIAKGGLIPATIIARELGIERIEVIQAHSYGYGSQNHVEPFNPSICQDKPLVISDLDYNGKIMTAVRDAMKAAVPHHHIQFAVLYVKGSLDKSNHLLFAHRFPPDLHLLLPWDMAPQFQAPLVTQLEPAETS